MLYVKWNWSSWKESFDFLSLQEEFRFSIYSMTAYATIERVKWKRNFFISSLIFMGLHGLDKGNSLGEKEVVELHLAVLGNATLWRKSITNKNKCNVFRTIVID